MSTQDEFREFFVDAVGWSGRVDVLTDDYPLLENDVIDSMGIFELVEQIEQRYDVTIDDEDFVRENFQTLGSIVRLIGSKTAAR